MSYVIGLIGGGHGCVGAVWDAVLRGFGVGGKMADYVLEVFLSR